MLLTHKRENCSASGGAMPLSLAEIEREVSQLSLDERARLISHLIATLEPVDEGDIEAAWEKEVLARSNAIQEGSVAAVAADEALARVRRSTKTS
jgi:putative addiction module component (TIGR02574 family)